MCGLARRRPTACPPHVSNQRIQSAGNDPGHPSHRQSPRNPGLSGDRTPVRPGKHTEHTAEQQRAATRHDQNRRGLCRMEASGKPIFNDPCFDDRSHVSVSRSGALRRAAADQRIGAPQRVRETRPDRNNATWGRTLQDAGDHDDGGQNPGTETGHSCCDSQDQRDATTSPARAPRRTPEPTPCAASNLPRNPIRERGFHPTTREEMLERSAPEPVSGKPPAAGRSQRGRGPRTPARRPLPTWTPPPNQLRDGPHMSLYICIRLSILAQEVTGHNALLHRLACFL